MPKKLERVNTAKCRTCTHGHRCLEIAKYGKITIMNCRHYAPKEKNFQFVCIPGEPVYILSPDKSGYLVNSVGRVIVDANGLVNYILTNPDMSFYGDFFTKEDIGKTVYLDEEECHSKVRGVNRG